MYENSEEIHQNCYFLKCDGMWGMFKSKNIIVTNGTVHCKLKQGSEIQSWSQMFRPKIVKKKYA